MKRLWNWFLTLIGKRFPLPPRHVLTYEEMQKYWNEGLNDPWRRQCKVFVYRVRKRTDRDQGANFWQPYYPPTGGTFMPTRQQILNQLGRADEPGDPFTIRIDREWEVSPGMKRKEEVCIANFEL